MQPVSFRRIVLAARPDGVPRAADFRLESAPLEPLAGGEILLRTQYLSMEPDVRTLLGHAGQKNAEVARGQTIPGGTVSEVVGGGHRDFPVGSLVLGATGWQDYAVSDGTGLELVDLGLGPASAWLGVLGRTGLTGYVGTMKFGQPARGETLVVSAAAGAVGSIAGQVARIRGARVVGIAGGAAKCAYLVEELGFDAAVDHSAADFPKRLGQACPDGIDVDFESVGGSTFEAILPLLNVGARIVVCGVISRYNDATAAQGALVSSDLLEAFSVKRLSMRGFTVGHFIDRFAEYRKLMAGWLRDGSVRHREDVVDGLEQAPAAFARLFRGDNIGKQLVRVIPPGPSN